MTDTRALLHHIAALRQRLEQAEGLADFARSAAAMLLKEPPDPGRVQLLEQKINDGAQQTALVDDTIRRIRASLPATQQLAVLPTQLTARAHRLVKQGRELLGRLRELAEDPLLLQDRSDPLAVRYRETAAIAYTALQTVQAYPDAPSAQLRLCDGLEATLGVVAERLAALQASLAQRRREADWVSTLADLLSHLHAGERVDLQPFVRLAEELLLEARQGGPLRFLYTAPVEPARFVAAHSVTVAQVVARLVPRDPEFRGEPREPVVAALIHDVGMLAVPVQILAHPGPLTDEQRRIVESHTHAGGEAIHRAFPNDPLIAEAAACHHERSDGRGYPAGLRETQISSPTRLLTVCDVYAALCCPRPHRSAFDPRTALTDTLLLAEQGALDRHHAERLLHLSFYPAGSVVELADGSIGLVLATPLGPRDLGALARPVVALLTDERGRPLPIVRPLDLAQCDGPTIIRTLPAAKRRKLLGRRYPEWA
ncbi:MAG TPA: HD domain-containing phosphohydrolase [Gemmataceae bacterium]|nr:HD domain-containing phosphohydrolase [Gemmataceae bacterium]